MNLGDIAKKINGTVIGDASLEITDVHSIETAIEGHITFLAEKKFFDKLKRSKASAVLVDSEQKLDINQIVTPRPELAFAQLLNLFHPQSRPRPGIHPTVVLGENVILGKRVTLSPLVYVGNNVQIGDDVIISAGVVVNDNCVLGNHVILHSNVTLYSDSVLGDHVVLHSGVVVGSDGFGYTTDEKGRHVKINQIGNVVIEDNVEVGANSCIDRAAMGITLIKEGTKIDNLVQIAHNCTIGEHCIAAAQVGIAGSSKLGHHVILGGQAAISDHLTIGDHVSLAAKSASIRDLESNGIYGGFPALPISIWKRCVGIFSKLPDLVRKIRVLERRLNDIEKNNGGE